MKKQIYFGILIFLLILTLACGGVSNLVDSFIGSESEESPAVSDGAADSAVPTLTPTPEESQATEEPGDTAALAPTEGTVFSGVMGLDQFSSYRIDFVMDFNGERTGQPVIGGVTMLMENTNEPIARYLSMELNGSLTEEAGGFNRTDIYEVDGTMYLYAEAAGFGQWISMESDGAEASSIEGDLFVPEEDLSIPDTVDCSGETEMVNGVSTTHCTFNANDVSDQEFTADSATGHVWVATDGDYIVKYTLEGIGFQATANDDMDFFDKGDIYLEYSIRDINATFTITPPAEALNAIGFDLDGLLGGGSGDEQTSDEATSPGTSSQLPYLDDAQEVTSLGPITTYYTNNNITIAIDFYRQALSSDGWTEETDIAFIAADTALLSFNNGSQNLTLTLNQEADGRINVGLIITDQ